MPAFDGRLQGLTNTFQVVLATNGTHSFVAFIYGDIQWTTDDAQIGFYAGDGGGFFPLLSTNDAQGNGVNSNVDARGVFVYRTDSELMLRTLYTSDLAVYNIIVAAKILVRIDLLHA